MDRDKYMYKIEHNPFFFNTEIWKKNKKTTEEQFSALKGCRFQDVVDDIPKAFHKVANEAVVTILFTGRAFEYEDLKNACDSYEEQYHVKFEIKHEVKFDHINIEKIKALSEMMKTSPIEKIRDQKSIDSFLSKLNNEFDIAVVATVSSGKSTLINAMMGDSFLPAGNEATTAKIFHIKDIDELETFKAVVYDKEKNVIETCNDLNIGDLNKFNENEDVFEIKIEGDLPNISSEVMNLVLIDTPGTNNSQDSRHKETTLKLIKDDENNPIVLFILDANKPRVNDEHELLETISEEIQKKNTQQTRDRFIFVLNKANELDEDEVTTTISNTQKYLYEKFQIKDAKIFPISAEEALIARKLANGIKLSIKENKKKKSIEVDDKVDDEDNTYSFFELYAPISNHDKNRIQKSIKQAKERGDWSTQALHHSGVTALEMMIDDYVSKYAIPIKVKEAFEKIDNLVLVKELEDKLLEEAQDNKEKRSQYEKDLMRVREVISKQYQIKNFKKKINMLRINDIPIKKLRKKLTDKFTTMYSKDIFTEELEIGHAERQIKSALTTAVYTRIDIDTELKRQLSDELHEKSKKIIDDFKDEIEKLFDAKDVNSLVYKKLKSTLTSVPNPKELLAKSQKTKKVSSKVERDADFWDIIGLGIPYLFREDKVTVHSQKKVSDPKKIKEKFDLLYRKLLNDITQYENRAAQELKALKKNAETVIEEYMEDIKRNVINEYQLMNDRNALFNKINENNKHAQWLKRYSQEKKEIYKIIQ